MLRRPSQYRRKLKGGSMKTRSDYIAGNVSHREYYGQFVDRELKQGLVQDLGIEKILASKSEAFNDIPLAIWDCLPCMRSVTMTEKLVACGDFPTLAGLCCIAKEGARQLREENK